MLCDQTAEAWLVVRIAPGLCGNLTLNECRLERHHLRRHPALTHAQRSRVAGCFFGTQWRVYFRTRMPSSGSKMRDLSERGSGASGSSPTETPCGQSGGQIAM